MHVGLFYQAYGVCIYFRVVAKEHNVMYRWIAWIGIGSSSAFTRSGSRRHRYLELERPWFSRRQQPTCSICAGWQHDWIRIWAVSSRWLRRGGLALHGIIGRRSDVMINLFNSTSFSTCDRFPHFTISPWNTDTQIWDAIPAARCSLQKHTFTFAGSE